MDPEFLNLKNRLIQQHTHNQLVISNLLNQKYDNYIQTLFQNKKLISIRIDTKLQQLLNTYATNITINNLALMQKYLNTKNQLIAQRNQLIATLNEKYLNYIQHLLNQKRLISSEFNQKFNELQQLIVSTLPAERSSFRMPSLEMPLAMQSFEMPSLEMDTLNSIRFESNLNNSKRRRLNDNNNNECDNDKLNVFICSFDGVQLRAYDINGTNIGIIVNVSSDKDFDKNGQWLTGFDFDICGNLYVSLYKGFVAKYQISNHSTLTRVKDNQFNHNIKQSLLTNNIIINEDDECNLCPEGLVIVENRKYNSIFVNCMSPINGIIQISFTGKIQRIISKKSTLIAPWALQIMPQYFMNKAIKECSFNKKYAKKVKNESLLLTVAEKNMIYVMDINGNIVKSLKIAADNERIGDFIYYQTKKHSFGLLIVNCQYGIIQIYSAKKFLLLKTINLNKYIKRFKELNNKSFVQMFGISIDTDGWTYFCDHDDNRIIKVCIDYDLIAKNKWNSSNLKIKVYATGVKVPNYCNWFNSNDIAIQM